MAASLAQSRLAGILAAAWLAAAFILLPGVGHAQLDKVRATMAALIEETHRLEASHQGGVSRGWQERSRPVLRPNPDEQLFRRR
jgi:hypothetical protein